ncbi:MAG: HTTM domain-containing protein [Fuerstiella sp.]|nr:HTTM domain-containing protein [Fuerstiella sp.]MDG2128912.1 HTTM domain-containing protein [Fuerstiella sp.]
MNPPPAENSPRTALGRFFFARETPYGMALLRIVLPLAAGVPMTMRFPFVRELFTTDGSPVQLFEMFRQGSVLPVLTPAVAVPLYGIMLLCMLTSIVGFRTRTSLWVTTVLYLYFNALDGVGTLTKYSVIASHMLLLLSLSHAGSVWSVDAFLKKRSGDVNVLPPRFPVWPARLVQLLFAFIYFGASITKIQTAEFFSGEQMRYWMLSDWNYENPVGEIVAMSSPLLLISAYLSVIWEVLFAFLVWRPRGRIVMLGAGAMFHFMTWLTLGLYVFPAICLSGYLAFVSEQDILRLRRISVLRPIRAAIRLPALAVSRVADIFPQTVPAGVVWICLLAAAAIGATEAELQMDIYQSRSEAGLLKLMPIDRDIALTMLRDKTPVREHDKFFNFEIGTSTIGYQLSNRRTDYSVGDTMIAQCNLNPPHEDMWVECLLQDDEERTIEQFGQFVPRESLRANFFYTVDSKLVAGRYSMVLKSANQEIYRRHFSLSGNSTPQIFDVSTN